MKNVFMVEINLPHSLSPEIVSRIPIQRMHINQQMQKGIITSYTLALDRKHLWTCVAADNPYEVDEVINSFPISEFITYRIHELAFHDTANALLHEFSLN